MLPIRWDPFKDLGSLQREFDDLLRQTFGGGALTETGTSALTLSPAVNSFVKDNVYHLQAELPGVAREDLDVSIEENMIVIKGERKETKEKEERDYLYKESRFGSFVRKMSLPEGVNTDKVQATCNDGVLEITMPIEKKLTSTRKVMIEGKEDKKGRKIH